MQTQRGGEAKCTQLQKQFTSVDRYVIPRWCSAQALCTVTRIFFATANSKIQHLRPESTVNRRPTRLSTFEKPAVLLTIRCLWSPKTAKPPSVGPVQVAIGGNLGVGSPRGTYPAKRLSASPGKLGKLGCKRTAPVNAEWRLSNYLRRRDRGFFLFPCYH